MVSVGTRLQVLGKKDSELKLLGSLILSWHSESSPLFTIVESTSGEMAESQLETADGDLIKGSAPIAEYLLRTYPSPLSSKWLGESELDYAEIHQWLSYAMQNVKPAVLSDDKSQCKTCAKFINDHLSTKTFMVSNILTLSDVFLLAIIHPYMTKVTEKLRGELCHFTRWFDLVQHLVGQIDLIAINVDYKVGAQQQAQPQSDAATTPTSPITEKPGGKDKSAANKKSADETAAPQKAKKEKKQKQPAEATAELSSYNPARLDIRVGEIVDVNQHENADSLYVEKIDLGESGGPRTIVSGLVKHVPIEQMRGRMVVVLCNLKPASMRGVKSEGMVLAATGADGKVELLIPPPGSKPGDKVFFDTFSEGSPDAVLNPKKKVWETIQPGLFTDDSLVACYKVIAEDSGADLGRICPMKTLAGKITVATVAKATIK